MRPKARRYFKTALLAAFGLCPIICAEAADRSQSKIGVAPHRGVVRALHQASIGIDLPIRVERLHFREAQSFRKGQVLVTFDCKRVRAEYAAAAAASREMRLTMQSQAYLESRGAAGKFDVEISKARVEKAEAEAAAIGARIEQCTIVAPFDGRIADLKINEHEVPAAGQPFISLVDETHFEIDLILPSHSLRSLQLGASLQFMVDETAIAYEAKIIRIGAIVDPVSQSIKVVAEFSAPDDRIVAGMTGTALIPSLEGIR